MAFVAMNDVIDISRDRHWLYAETIFNFIRILAHLVRCHFYVKGSPGAISIEPFSTPFAEYSSRIYEIFLTLVRTLS